MVTALTTFEYYDGTYKTAMGSVTVPHAEFNRYAIKASNMIRKYTFGNIDEAQEIPESVQFCCCELAEHMYHCAVRDADSSNNVASEKDGSWSVTYTSAESIRKNDEYEQKGIIYNWLADTGLMYCGVR